VSPLLQKVGNCPSAHPRSTHVDESNKKFFGILQPTSGSDKPKHGHCNNLLLAGC